VRLVTKDLVVSRSYWCPILLLKIGGNFQLTLETSRVGNLLFTTRLIQIWCLCK